MSTGPLPQVARAGRRTGLFLRLAVVGILAVTGVLLVRFTPLGELLSEERIVAISGELRANPWTPFLLLVAYVVSGPIGLPVTPFLLAGGLVFGPWWGTLYNSIGLVLNAMSTYWVGRVLGREAVTRLAGPRLRRAEALFEKRGFWPLVQVRFLPIPAPVVAYAAALAGVTASRFLVTSAMGLTPAGAAHTVFAPKIILEVLAGREPVWLVVQYVALMAVFNAVALTPQVRETLYRRRRYREVLETRRNRRTASEERPRE